MPILGASNTCMRGDVENYLNEARSSNSNYRVLDVGGMGAQCWSKWANAVADIQPGADIVGDICYPDMWMKIGARGPWDFIICTHTLEDVRNPELALMYMQLCAKAGFIATPNKHTELCPNMETGDWVGYGHHRWIFTVRNGVLRVTAKWPVTSAFIRVGPPEWLDKNLVGGAAVKELGFIWEYGFPFEFIRDDFPGLTSAGHQGILQMYRDELREGL